MTHEATNYDQPYEDPESIEFDESWSRHHRGRAGAELFDALSPPSPATTNKPYRATTPAPMDSPHSSGPTAPAPTPGTCVRIWEVG